MIMRYILSNHIAKKCPKGTWLDKETGKCIPIDEWKSKYGGKRERTDENKDKPKRCPKGKWRDPQTGECISQDEWRKRNQKNHKPEKEKESFKPRDNITPDTSGIAKAPILALTRGHIKKEVEKKFKPITEQAQTTSEELYAIERPEDFTRKVGRAFAGTNVNIDERLKLIDPAGMVMIATDMADVISEHPIGVCNLNGILFTEEDDTSSLMFYQPSQRTINFCGGYFKTGGYYSKWNDKTTDVNTVNTYSVAYDPVLKKASDEWSYHPEGSKVGQSFSHEYGHHLVQSLVVAHSHIKEYYKNHPEEIPESYHKKEKEHQEKAQEFKDELLGLLSELGVSETDAMLYVYSATGEVRFSVIFRENEMEDGGWDGPVITSGNEKYRKIVDFMSKKGFKREGKKISPSFIGHDEQGQEIYHLTFEFEDPHKSLVFNELPPAPPLDKLLGDRSIQELYQGDDYDLEIKWEFAGRIVEECEELYKELYGVDEIIPSDAYSGYGYFGPLQDFGKEDYYYEYKGRRKRKGKHSWEEKGDPIYEKKKKKPIDIKDKSYSVRERVAGERIAEAICDCTVRKEHANSMSVLIASAVDYEFYRLATGTEESFSDFLRANYDFSKAGKPIIKSLSNRYILFI